MTDTPLNMLLNPPISEEAVRAALNGLLYTASARVKNPLEALVLVDMRLRDPLLPHSPQIRRYTLAEVLTDIITERLRGHRAALTLALPKPDDTREVVLMQIALDGATENIELIGWSWLYARYVRVDLSLMGEAFMQTAVTDERTLRRYQVHGVRRLTERLIALEHAARREG